MKNLILTALSSIILSSLASADTLFSSSFTANTGATVLAGNADGTSGSASVVITDWIQDASLTSITGLTAISPGAGFVQLQNGAAAFANANTVFINENLNVGARTAPHGYSVSFTIDKTWHLSNLNITTGQANGTGSTQAFSHDITYALSGGTLGATVTSTSTIDYSGITWKNSDFDLAGTTLGAGTYTLSVTVNNMVGGGAYAAFDGITLSGLTERTLFASSFTANTGATVLAGNADGTSGSASVAITDWTQDASLTSITGLTAISPGAGFVQLQNGAAVLANANTVFINENLNVGARTAPHGYSVSFTIDDAWSLSNLNIISGQANGAGGAQAFSHDITYALSGGTLGATVTSTTTIDYSGITWKTSDFNLAGTSLGAGTYTLTVTANNMIGGGAYAAFDGVTLVGFKGAAPPLINAFTVNPTLFEPGDSVTLSWNVTGSTSVSIDQGVGSVAAVGSIVLTPNDTATYTLTALNGAAPATAQVTAVMDQTVEVYLLGGQSNMQGLGQISELTPAQLTPPPNVFFWNQGTSSFEPLIPGTTVTGSGGQFGPEIALATAVSNPNRKIYLIKYSVSGMPLDSAWSGSSFDDHTNTWKGDPPAPNRTNFYPGTSPSDPNQGTLYKNGMLPRFQAGIAAITSFGYTPVIRGFIWMQGEQDSKKELSAGRYATNLKRLRDRLAEDLGLSNATDLPLVFGQVLPYTPWETRFVYRDLIRAQQASADMDSGSANAIPRARMISTDAYTLKADNVHYDTASQILLGTDFALGIQQARNQETEVIKPQPALDVVPGSGASTVSLSWLAQYGTIYNVETSNNLTDWSPLTSDLITPTTGNLLTITNDLTAERTFYRVRTE